MYIYVVTHLHDIAMYLELKSYYIISIFYAQCLIFLEFYK